MSSSYGNDPNSRIGAVRVAGEPRRRRPLWLLALLGVLAALLLLLLSQCGGDGEPTASTTPGPAGSSAGSGPSTQGATSAPASSAPASSAPASSAPATSAAATSAAATSAPATPATTAAPSGSGAGGAAAAGVLTAASTSLLPLDQATGADGDLSRYVDDPAQGRGVRVQSVPADEGFWVGTGRTDRVWVQLTGPAGESSYKVRRGDRVDFTGTVVAHGPDFAREVGVSRDEGAALLGQQKAHLEVPKTELKLSR